jgi:hypothetical protein
LHFDQHEAKPRFCEEVLSYGVIQAGTHVDKLGRSTFATASAFGKVIAAWDRTVIDR